ncbi:dTDP-4-dehydrorhamnose 3,5-epimerase [Dietzia sp. Die43]|uniref:dTDP-4-dehydrorhamnose 3,5-epimerase family protein n=1 Tax=Dietzia sp. Die43 TaxID=2926011 RepID=UPI00211960DA|nr:dTDP-4-dehydrorhamnose 3,5-epimerase [Dietzia sp. Die43]
MIEELGIAGSFVYTPRQFGDDRGTFLEWFKAEVFDEIVGHPLNLRQANLSVSSAGVLRGIHFADTPPGQAKYVACPRGAILDVVVDLRVGSPSFGHWESVVLDDVDRRCLYLSEGLGHAFLSLEDNSTVVYLCSSEYSPGREHGISPLDEQIGISWPTTGRSGQTLSYQLSSKDADAPSLKSALQSGLLPDLEGVSRYVQSLSE